MPTKLNFHSRHLCAKNGLKLVFKYSKIQKFPEVIPRTPIIKGRGRVEEGKGGKGMVGEGGDRVSFFQHIMLATPMISQTDSRPRFSYQ
jgi:hypothetical protein